MTFSLAIKSVDARPQADAKSGEEARTESGQPECARVGRMRKSGQNAGTTSDGESPRRKARKNGKNERGNKPGMSAWLSTTTCGHLEA